MTIAVEDMERARPHTPETCRFKLQSDEEEHHHHAEFGKMHNIFPFFTDKIENKGANDNAGKEVAKDRAHAQPFGKWDEDDSCREIDQRIMEKSVIHETTRPLFSASQSLRYSCCSIVLVSYSPLASLSRSTW